MLIEFSGGKLIANMHELTVRISGPGNVTLQAAADALKLIASANVIAAYDGVVAWSIKLDSREQLAAVAEEMSLPLE